MSRIAHALGGSVSGRPDAGVAAHRLGFVAYMCMAAGLVLYVIAIWGEVYLDTRHAPAVAPDRFFESHRHWRLRTALLFLIWSVLGGLTLPFGFGWLIVVPAYAWYLYRVAKGLVCFQRGVPVGIGKAVTEPGFAD